jgi:hypothetical protein
MTISEFIQAQIILPRLKQHSTLVVYDPEGRYRELCLGLANKKYQVIDASESSITSRADSMAALQKMGQSNTKLEGLLIYIPAKAPLSDEDKQRDPFAIYGASGSIFPDPERDGDEYQSLCLTAKPDHATEIRRIFANDPNPNFSIIDEIGGGAGWPTLQALLRVESARDILFALLAPEEDQKSELKAKKNWITEAKSLFSSTLNLKLITKMRSWPAISEELWRFLLFSEFIFDVPGEIPQALDNVPRAPQEACPLIYDICDRLRNDLRTQVIYIEHAEKVENELALEKACEEIDDFGIRDTFPFEERVSFQQAVDALQKDDVDQLRQILKRHERSIWVGRGENQTQWTLVKTAASLVQACNDSESPLSEHTGSLEKLVDYYTSTLREVDRCQREFEAAQGEILNHSADEESVKALARRSYRKIIDKVQDVFIRHVDKTGWPLAGRLANVNVFDQMIAPALQESGRRVAVLLIDAMRYELGVELAKQLSIERHVDVQAACAQLPTTTPIGMASLLPGADSDLVFTRKDKKCIPMLNGQELNSVPQRMGVLKNIYGQRFAETDLASFVSKKRKLDGTVELLVLRSNEMDNDFETNPEAAPSLISRTFQKVLVAIHKLQTLDFQDVFIVTDHGFYLNTALEPGDVCTRPPGDWVNMHGRMMLGDGQEDASNLVLSTDHVSIKGDFSQVAIPRAMVSYRAGQSYFHGGLSLQESIVPVLAVRIRQSETLTMEKLDVILKYKQGATKITTRLPVIEISAVGQSGLFNGDQIVEVMIEAHDEKGQIIGEAKPDGAVDPITRKLTLKPDEAVKVTLKMDLDFEGKFSVKALDPNTQAARGIQLDLETDYMV